MYQLCMKNLTDHKYIKNKLIELYPDLHENLNIYIINRSIYFEIYIYNNENLCYICEISKSGYITDFRNVKN
jgi:hypothetical protein